MGVNIITTTEIKDIPLEEIPQMYNNPSGLPYTAKLDGNRLIGSTVLPVIKKITTEVKPVAVYPTRVKVRHGMGEAYHYFCRAKLDTGSGYGERWEMYKFDGIDSSDYWLPFYNSGTEPDAILFEIYVIDYAIN